ncbi:MAG: Arabinose efflux permease family protein [Parcubacteria group bacterium GW2011_GWC1_42_11]|uniref:Arabinose efflux permease family protein n=1 Tax=Candidatus Nomurabacteria bacterium GW2011_GWC2_42_20 TaxID=1618756 RepID=A0A0G1CBW3_9BACT|nr:MAG: Arabinose efflux permease family protein [Parcubacteria group bacterium GW2011_GWC1_42_11]KKS47113.1 MAG: Arabinose efflux permease family protein [Candidatus Nomurabacteria bacterium GW2011_GWC2_42_20]KKS58884.1 MAG: Arabinose efflux permease family protein [Candidatus Nomurabacteria bacterium GW2011_GWA2_42_41]KKT09199.1 MAG: Arabinose efflux permease family protein [Candidatus Nomurabacteria bacterium GW2011_GWB1_43_20]
MTNPIPKKVLFLLVYLTSFLYSFHYALPIYIESSFIAQYLPTEKAVGLIFSFSAIFTVAYTFLLPRILKRFGNYRATLTVMGVEILTLLALALISTPIPTIILFIIFLVASNVIFLNLDYFVESFTDNEKTGSMRGIFMTILNVSIAVGPFVAGLMLTDHDFWKIWVASAVVLSFGFYIIAKYFKDYVDPHYLVHPFRKTFNIIKESHDLHSIIFMHFLLSFFYVWMVIYTPIYLNMHIGIPMNEILGIIIPFALLPFVLFEVFLGNLADKKFGEKEILTAGFIIMGISTAGISWITTSSVLFWAVLLFITRTGASAVEAMTESYFYKQVGPADAHIITFMRTTRATAYIIGPLIGYVALSFLDFHYLFLVLGILMLCAIPYSLTIKDTR